ncbi:MAG: hypothetical protein GX660_27915 [Clostridiaceae bacterium]|nr:hypothetical protein [Clostridiaceae bacterium]
MRLFFLTPFILVIFLTACEKDNLKHDNFNAFIDTTIFSSDTLNISFGYFGDEEGIEIISHPKHSEYCDILNDQWEERILRYIPQEAFLGIDTMAAETSRGSDGAGPSTEIDTVLIVIKVVRDDFHKKLIGKWNWIWSCGGFTGGCWYPGPFNYEQIEFTYNMRYIEKQNDTISHDFEYFIIDSFMNGPALVYEIGFENGYDTYYRFDGDELNIQTGDFWKGYERIE